MGRSLVGKRLCCGGIICLLDTKFTNAGIQSIFQSLAVNPIRRASLFAAPKFVTGGFERYFGSGVKCSLCLKSNTPGYGAHFGSSMAHLFCGNLAGSCCKILFRDTMRVLLLKDSALGDAVLFCKFALGSDVQYLVMPELIRPTDETPLCLLTRHLLGRQLVHGGQVLTLLFCKFILGGDLRILLMPELVRPTNEMSPRLLMRLLLARQLALARQVLTLLFCMLFLRGSIQVLLLIENIHPRRETIPGTYSLHAEHLSMILGFVSVLSCLGNVKHRGVDIGQHDAFLLLIVL